MMIRYFLRGCLYKLISIANKVCTPFPPYRKNDISSWLLQRTPLQSAESIKKTKM